MARRDHRRGSDGEGAAARRRRRQRRALGVVLLGSSVLLTTQPGCNVLGALAYKFSGSPTMRARYAPPKDKTLVVVENYHNPAMLRLEADAVARHLSQELTLHEVVPVVDPGEAEAYRQAQGGGYRRMPIDAIGRSLGAKQVIYVDLDRFDVNSTIGSDLLAGQAVARVRVVGEGGTVLWPTDSAGGFPINVKVQPQPAAPGTGDTTVRRQLHADLADRIAKLFYDWKADSADGDAERFSG
jgi:hypothetical protein